MSNTAMQRQRAVQKPVWPKEFKGADFTYTIREWKVGDNLLEAVLMLPDGTLLLKISGG